MRSPYTSVPFYFVLGLLFLTHCKKEEFVNLQASLSLESPTAVVLTEGEQGTITLSLDKVLTEDLLLSFNFSTDGIVNYINEEDYASTIEVKTTEDNQWRSYPMHNVVFPAKRKSATFRWQTHDDKKIEITEEFSLRISKASASAQITLENPALPAISVTVHDNEIAPLGNSGDIGGLMVFSFDEQYTPTLAWIRPTVDYPEEKAWIDAGVIPQEMLTDLQTVFRQSTSKISHFIFDYSRGGETGAFVTPTEYLVDISTEKDAWVMSIDAGIAYPNLASGDERYNHNGVFGYVLFHEWGHIETLNRDTQIRRTTDRGSCTTFFVGDACLFADGALNLFIQKFYTIEKNSFTDYAIPNENFTAPKFVSDYAQTDDAEDIAETFAYYIIQDRIPSATASSSGALQKINLIKNYPDFTAYRALRNEVRAKFIPLEDDYFPIYNKKGKQGNRVGCLDRYKEAIAGSKKRPKNKLHH